jgi:hypothetical protein
MRLLQEAQILKVTDQGNNSGGVPRLNKKAAGFNSPWDIFNIR